MSEEWEVDRGEQEMVQKSKEVQNISLVFDRKYGGSWDCMKGWLTYCEEIKLAKKLFSLCTVL